MPRSRTYRYVVHLRVKGFHYSPSFWRVKRQGKIPGWGIPNDDRLANYVRDFEESCRVGVNKHLGEQHVLRAEVRDQLTGGVVARYCPEGIRVI